MERDRQCKDAFFNLDHPFRSFPGFGNFPSLFGSRDPFDDPFFTRPFSSFGGRDIFGDPFRPLDSMDSGPDSGSRINACNTGSGKGLLIEELNSDDETELTGTVASMIEEEQHVDESHKLSSSEPSVEHPDNGDQVDGQGKQIMSLNSRSDQDKIQGAQNQTKSFTVHTCKVTYRGVDGAYYTSTRTRSRGSDGVVLEESKEADKTTGQATHRISRGLNDKGHSVTRKLNSDGKVDTVQTLHNLHEDELAGFETSWTAKGRSILPSSNIGHDARINEGGIESFRADSFRSWMPSFADGGRLSSGTSRTGNRKVVRINIE